MSEQAVGERVALLGPGPGERLVEHEDVGSVASTAATSTS